MFLQVSTRFQQLLFSRHYNSLRQLHYNSLRINRSFHNTFTHYRSSVQAVINCYENRSSNHIEPRETTSLVETKVEPAFHVAITARPDEFHKLPPKCSACGSILQTKIETQTGYINEKKIVESLKDNTIHKIACYSCFRLRHHNESTHIHIKGINSNDAMNQLQHLKHQTALILYVVDLFDIEGTMMSNILQLIGPRKRLIIVGNKLDRIPIDTEKHLVGKQVDWLKNSLKNIAFKNGLDNCNLKDVCLISSKTGYGIKNLVEIVCAHRDTHMNVFLVGCTNTGKSTLYNLLANLLNVHKNNDLPPQAIEHHMPGTTKSFLRENISSSNLMKLSRRLDEEPYEDDQVFNFDDDLLSFLNADKKDSMVRPMGKKPTPDDGLKLLNASNAVERRKLEIVDNKKSKKEIGECFIYDTPGIFNPSQLIQFLTPPEINYLSPTLWVVPRTVMLVPGYSLCVGGIARLNYLDISKAPREAGYEKYDDDDSPEILHASNKGIYVTAMISPNVPLHVTKIEIAEEKYETWFSKNFFKLPFGTPERFQEYPKLKEHEYTILGKGRNDNACDLVLHGIGWLSVASVWATKVSLALYTPNGEGQNLRRIPLLPFSVRRKSKRGVINNGRMSYRMYTHTRKKSPQLIASLEEKYKTVDTTKLWKKKIKEIMVQERFELREKKRLERLEAGIILGRQKTLFEKEKKFRLLSEKNFAKQLAGNK